MPLSVPPPAPLQSCTKSLTRSDPLQILTCTNAALMHNVPRNPCHSLHDLLGERVICGAEPCGGGGRIWGARICGGRICICMDRVCMRGAGRHCAHIPSLELRLRVQGGESALKKRAMTNRAGAQLGSRVPLQGHVRQMRGMRAKQREGEQQDAWRERLSVGPFMVVADEEMCNHRETSSERGDERAARLRLASG